MNINSKKVTFGAVCYCWIGIVVFLLGWVRWYWALPAVAAIVFGLYQYGRNLWGQPAGEPLYVSRKMLVFFAAVMFFWLIVSGSGGLIGQAEAVDWTKHNLILSDLVAYDWPVYYHNEQEDAMLSYYVAQYLVPALFGKVFHSLRAAELAMLCYNFIGLFLAALLLLRLVKAVTPSRQLVAIFIFVFFGVALFLGKALYGATAIGSTDMPPSFENGYWISNHIPLQYPYNYSHLRWAFPQTITPWIVTALFAQNKEKYEYYLLWAAPLLLHATFPFLGIALFMIGYFGFSMITGKNPLACIRKAFSLPNICAGLGGILIPLVYLYGNFGGTKPPMTGLTIIRYDADTVLYFCFCASFLCYSVVLFDRYKKNILFYLVNGILLFLPFLKGGSYNDLCMRASVPATFLLMVFCIDGLFAFARDKQKTGRAVILALLLCLGMYYPVFCMQDVLRNDPGGRRIDNRWQSLSEWAYKDGKVPDDSAYNYFAYDYTWTHFYRWFAKK